MNKEEHDEYHRRLAYILLILLATLILGSFFYHYVEGWRFLDSLYFSAATMTTIGYGDFTPKTDLGKLFSVFYFFISVGIAIYGMSVFASHFIEIREEHWFEQMNDAKKNTKKIGKTLKKLFVFDNKKLKMK